LENIDLNFEMEQDESKPKLTFKRRNTSSPLKLTFKKKSSPPKLTFRKKDVDQVIDDVDEINVLIQTKPSTFDPPKSKTPKPPKSKPPKLKPRVFTAPRSMDQLLFRHSKLNPQQFKKTFYHKVRKECHVRHDLTDLTVGKMRDIYHLYNSEYFLGSVTTDQPINFILSNQLSRKAGYCRQDSRSRQQYSIVIAHKMFLGLFPKDQPVHRANGLDCRNHLQVFLNVFEHELTHLFFFLHSPSSEHHGPKFQQLTLGLFGHTDFRHSLNTDVGKCGVTKLEMETRSYASFIHNEKEMIGRVIKLNPKTVGIRIFGETSMWRVSYSNILKKQPQVTRKELALEEKTINKMKTKDDYRLSQQVSFDHKGSPIFGTIIKLNPTRAKVKLINDPTMIYNVPYQLFL